GQHVARVLLADGFEVRALVRSPASSATQALADAEIVAGDLRDAASLARAARGCQVVFHVAALYALWAPDPRALYATNVAGTGHLLAAARAARVERVVYTSSVATIPPGTLAPGSERTCWGGDEAGFADPREVHSHYKRSKILAERLALREAAAGYPVVIVNPATPIGTGDVKPTPTGRVVLDFLRGRMPAYVDTGLNVIDVEDVAAGHLLALKRGQPGERYILGAHNLSLRELLTCLAEVAGLPAPRLRLPLAVALAAGAVSEVLEGRLARRRPSIPFEGVRMAGRPMYYDAAKAQKLLGLPRTPAREALRKSAGWFREHGYC
ncbi:MAG: hopanoid-associated sugar epimerase, partial [Chloroflexota bacterium]